MQRPAHSLLDPAQMLMPLSVAWRSISASSSVAEVEAVERGDVVLELRHAARADQRRGHARVAQRPGQRHLRERLAALRAIASSARIFASAWSLSRSGESEPSRLARESGRDAVEVAVGEHALGERREHDAAHALVAEHVQQAPLDPAVEQRVGRLVDEQRRAQLAQDAGRLGRALGRVGRDARVQRLALAHGGVERAERLLQRRAGVAPVRVEDVDVVEAHAPQALVEAREQVLARAEVAVGPGPHVVAGLRRDHELVAEGARSVLQQAPERLLRGAVGRAVVVGEVEVRDAEVERAAHDRAARLERPVGAEVLPQAERDRRQQQPAAARAVVRHAVVAPGGGYVGHAQLLRARGKAHRRYDLAAGPVAPRGRVTRRGTAARGSRPPRPAGRGRVGRLSAPRRGGCRRWRPRPVIDFGRQYATGFRTRPAPRSARSERARGHIQRRTVRPSGVENRSSWDVS